MTAGGGCFSASWWSTILGAAAPRSRHRKGNTHVQSILIEAAMAASRTRTRLGARFHRLHRRFGGKANKTAGKKAAFAVAHTLIKFIWVVLSTGQSYADLGHDYYTRRVNPESHAHRLIAQLEALSGKKIILVDHDDGPLGPLDPSHSDVRDPRDSGEAGAGGLAWRGDYRFHGDVAPQAHGGWGAAV